MKALEEYKELINLVDSFLGKKGFLRNGSCFYIKNNKNWGLIDFQKSKNNTDDEIKFTINIGIYSSALFEFFSPDSPEKKPSIEDCHWRMRLGFLLPNNKDLWWIIRKGQSLDSLASELMTYIENLAIPMMMEHISDEKLLNEWLSGKSPGLTDIQRLINLSSLLKIAKMENALHKIIKELESNSIGKPIEFMVKQHINSLST